MFFHTQLLISTLLAVSCVLGAPNVKRQGAGPACGSLGTGAYSTRGRIQVAAFNPNGSNDHEYGAELFLGGAGPTDPWHSTFTVSTIHPPWSRRKLLNLPRIFLGWGLGYLARLGGISYD